MESATVIFLSVSCLLLVSLKRRTRYMVIEDTSRRPTQFLKLHISYALDKLHYDGIYMHWSNK